MTAWLSALPNDPTDWLLEAENPWVRYNTLTQLLDRPAADPDVVAARQAMILHPQIQPLIQELSAWPGSPLKRHNDASHLLHKLSLLADLGLTRQDPGMDEIINQILTHRADDGLFQVIANISPSYGGTGEDMPAWALCDAPTVLYALASFGVDDGRVQAAADHLMNLVGDNGWLCTTQTGFRGPGRKADPCPYANLVALKALAIRGDWRESHPARLGVEMVLRHWELRKERKFYLFAMGSDFRKLKYPLVWYDLLHVTDVLSRYRVAQRDARFHEMMDILISQADAQGRFTPSSVWMAWKGWDFAQKKAPSPTITMAALRVIKQADER